MDASAALKTVAVGALLLMAPAAANAAQPDRGAPHARQLDLRLPASANERSVSFGRQTPASHSAADSLQLPALGSVRPGESRIGTMARQFKRDGLPVARLWQSDTSLLHLGLSPKGKPGLWFVGKLH